MSRTVQATACVLFMWASGFASSSVAQEVTYNRDVRPILSDKCFHCHGPDAQKRAADLRLDEPDVAKKLGAIVPFQPEKSEILRRVTTHDTDERMPPPNSKLERLTAKEVETLRKWIAAGAVYEPHWSFISLKPAKISDVDSPFTLADRPESSRLLDRLVAATWAQRKLTPRAPAPREMLIRRVCFDLTGLPPTPAEVEAFVSDRDPRAYEALVDRLLASPRFGERMAVDWLDVSRYADSYGFQVDRERDVWLWRDWVIKAFNDNLPFDQFVTWQVAGDLLPRATDEQILATAFNRLHQQESEGGSVEEEYRVEYVCDRVQTFATAFLGLTFECARCHDHKYDPITQRDYYALFGMFQNVDEAGLYSFFTNAVPTPAHMVLDAAGQAKRAALEGAVSEAERKLADLATARAAEFEAWLRGARTELRRIEPANEVARFPFDAVAQNKLANTLANDKPAVLQGANRLVPGKTGEAIAFTGDDPVNVPFGNYQRHEPFGIGLWLKTPDVKERAVVFHRSRAWTDAGSRGYELLIEEGRLKWSLIHFWPGNAISIRSKSPLQVDEWTHVLVTSDGSSRAAGLRLFVNGRPADCDILRDHLTKNITGGGGDTIALGERFRDRGFRGGMIDDFRVWSAAPTELEALAVFDSSAAEGLLRKPVGELTERERSTLREFYLRTVDANWKEGAQRVHKARAELTANVENVREIMVMRELETPKPSYVLFRGEYNQRRGRVESGSPASLTSFPSGEPRNRLGLARWLTSREHPLLARVSVNRLWQSLFGRGLVKTSEDFGSQGARPVHGELLDWLAWHYMETGWDTKRLIKTIVMSGTYRQTSVADPAQERDDPENEWLARGPRFRLPAEMIRDNALFASGLLKERLGGAPVSPYEMSEAFKPVAASGGDGVFRRSLYTSWRRTSPPPALLTFDAPRRGVCIAKRERTDSPLQALILLNGVQYVEAARVLGTTLHRSARGDVDRMIDEGFLRCLSRPPTAAERQICHRLHTEQLDYFRSHPEAAASFLKVGSHPVEKDIPPAEQAAAAALGQALLNHDACNVKR